MEGGHSLHTEMLDKHVKLLKSEVTPYIKKRMITQIAPTANTMNELYVQQPPGSRQLSIFISVDHNIQSY